MKLNHCSYIIDTGSGYAKTQHIQAELLYATTRQSLGISSNRRAGFIHRVAATARVRMRGVTSRGHNILTITY